MKKLIVTTILLLGSLVFGVTPVERYGTLQVIGSALCDSAGNPVQLRGMSTHGIQYFDEFYNENVIQSLAVDWKADIIRVSCYVNEGWPTYLDNPQQWQTYIDQMVDWAEKYGIYVLIDWHMLSPGDPNYYLKEAKEFWSYMASTHGHKPHVLFEICNEPNNDGLTTWKYDPQTGTYVEDNVLVEGKNVTWPIIKTYADTITGIIRAKSEIVAIVGTPNWASNPEAVIGNKLDFSNVMYTMHFYAASHGESYRKGVENAIKNDIPVFVTEFGTQDASGDGVNDFLSSQLWIDLLNKYQISWCNWNLSNDERTGAVFKESFSGGAVESYSDTANMKESGKWIYSEMKKMGTYISKISSAKTVPLTATISGRTLILSTSVPVGSSIALFDLTGRKILAREISGSSAVLPNIVKGVYIAEILAGKSSVVQKVSIQ